ncbi:MAG: naphthoate synthase, partial [Actinomycetota bacterium]|nr:naphthoate synthase [Actinomycetota bacterium]
MSAVVSELFDPEVWVDVPGFGELTDVTYHQDTTGRIARVAFNRPEVRNAFRPHTVDELYRALDDARQNPK